MIHPVAYLFSLAARGARKDASINRRDYAAAEKFWSPNYIQHSAHIAPARDGLFSLIKASPPSLRYEHGLIIAEGDFVVVHGRYSNTGLPRTGLLPIS